MAAEPLRIGSAPPRAPSHCRAGAPGLTLTPGDRGPDCGQEPCAPWPASVAPPPALAGRAPPPCRPPPEPGARCPRRLRLRCEVYADPDERTRPPWLRDVRTRRRIHRVKTCPSSLSERDVLCASHGAGPGSRRGQGHRPLLTRPLSTRPQGLHPARSTSRGVTGGRGCDTRRQLSEERGRVGNSQLCRAVNRRAGDAGLYVTQCGPCDHFGA